MTQHHLAPPIGAVLLLALSGCAAPPQNIYVLNDAPSSGPGASSQLGLPTIELRTVGVPDYLDTTDILRRTGPNQVKPSPSGQWGERLSVGLTDALAAHLALLIPGAVIVKSEAAVPSLRLLIQIEQFDVAQNGLCTVAARWQIVARDRHTILAAERATLTVTATAATDEAVTAALSRAVAELSQQIAPALQGKI